MTNALKHLQQFKSVLVNSRSAGEKSTEWYCLHRPRVKAELDLTPKILVQGTRNPRLKIRIVATMDEVGVYGTQGMNFIIPKEKSAPIYYLLAILNSSLINYLYATKFLNVAIKAEYLKDTPIPKVSVGMEKDLNDLARKILAAKKRNPEADTSALEREIDQLVYRLYGLTEEEIKVVEGK